MNIIFGIVFIIIGIVLVVVVYPKQKNNSTEIQYMQTKTVDELKSMFNQMSETGLGNDYREYVELKGKIVSNNPVNAPFSNREVAYCESELIQVIEEVERYRDSNGNMQTRTKKRENRISHELSSQEILFKDSSSDEILVLEANAVGCKFDIPETTNRFEPKMNLGKYSNYLSRFSLNMGSDVTGYKMIEKTIDLNQDLYVIGEAFKSGDKIHIGKPMDKKKPFIVSTKSEDALVNSSKRNAIFSLIGGIALALVGIISFFK